MADLLPLLSAQQTHEWLDHHEAILIDVRGDNAYKALHVPHSLHASDVEHIAALIAAHPTERVILLCQNGNQSTQISQSLQQQAADYAGILFYILDGGLNAWRNAGLPVIRDSGAFLPIEQQVEIGLGSVILLGILFSWLFSGLWLTLSIAVAVGMIYAGLTGWYGFHQLALLLPWNKAS
jgi:rhodanese-related sulfurtransferase